MLRALAALCLLLSFGCGREQPTHIVLISIDSLRADHLGSYGYPKPTSPVLDALAQGGALFEHARTSTSWTLPAHATLLTGVLDPVHGVRQLSSALSPDAPTLAGRLQRAGWATGAVVSGPFLHPRHGLQQGFDDYLNCMGFLRDDFSMRELADPHALSHADVTSPCVVERARQWLDEHREGPAFLFLHFWDVHYDYVAPDSYVRRFDPDYNGTLDASRYERNPKIARDMAPRDLEHLVSLYDAEIAWTDEHLGQLFAAIDALGIRRNTLLVVTSDHGEAFFEHGKKGHQKDLHAEVLNVPLILQGPGIPSGHRVKTPVALVDVAPTILTSAGLRPDFPGQPWAGISLRELLHAGPAAPSAPGREPGSAGGRPLYAELVCCGKRLYALESGSRKLMRNARTRQEWSYALEQDPREQDPLPVTREELARFKLLSTRMKQGTALWPRAGKANFDDLSELLRGLGYVE